MRTRTSCVALLATICLPLPGEAAPSYVESGPILTLTRENLPLESDALPEHLEGTQVCTVGWLLGGRDTFWLWHGQHYHEYDLAGSELRNIPMPSGEETQQLGAVISAFLAENGIYVLWERHAGASDRLSVQFHSFADGTWAGPVRIPNSVRFESDRTGVLYLRWAANRSRFFVSSHGEVWIRYPGKELGIRISEGGLLRSAIDTMDVVPAPPVLARTSSDTPSRSGPCMRVAGGQHRDYRDYEVLSGAGDVLGRLHWIVPRDESGDILQNREILCGPRWAILDDGTILELRLDIRGQPSDKIKVVRWTL
jgi:hypothetical protein